MKRHSKCRHPACNAPVYTYALSGVCELHRHVRGVCGCRHCEPYLDRATYEGPRPLPPGQKQVRVPVHSTHSSVASSTTITMPAPPWEADQTDRITA